MEENIFKAKELELPTEHPAEYVVDKDRPGLVTAIRVNARFGPRYVNADVTQLDLDSLRLYVAAHGNDWEKFCLEVLGYGD